MCIVAQMMCTGPAGTIYGGLSFELELLFPTKYPCSPPKIKFITPCFHPNIDRNGNICMDIFKDKWSAAYDISSMLQSIRSLLGGADCSESTRSLAPRNDNSCCRAKHRAPAEKRSSVPSLEQSRWSVNFFSPLNAEAASTVLFSH